MSKELLDAIEKTKKAQKKILEETYQAILSTLSCTVDAGKEAEMSSIPMNKIEVYVEKMVKSGFNKVSRKNGLGPIVD